jgi:hypothetical protein
LPVKIFRADIFRNEERGMLDLEDQINKFEKQLEGRGMQIKSVTMSAAMDIDEYYLYSVVLYNQMTNEEKL